MRGRTGASRSRREPVPGDDAPRQNSHPAQANNAYVFPALGHAAVLAGAREVSDDAFLAAAEALSAMTTEAELAAGKLFPDFDSIREVSHDLTARVCELMERDGQGVKPAGVTDWKKYVDSQFWEPEPETPSKL